MARKIEWTDAARADVRRIDRETAMRILEGLARFLLTVEGDVASVITASAFTISGTPFRSCPFAIGAKRTADGL